jgi:hypothetical protein
MIEGYRFTSILRALVSRRFEHRTLNIERRTRVGCAAKLWLDPLEFAHIDGFPMFPVSFAAAGSPRANEEEEPAASEGLKVIEQRRSRCGRSVSATFDFKTFRLSDAAGSSKRRR